MYLVENWSNSGYQNGTFKTLFMILSHIEHYIFRFPKNCELYPLIDWNIDRRIPHSFKIWCLWWIKHFYNKRIIRFPHFNLNENTKNRFGTNCRGKKQEQISQFLFHLFAFMHPTVSNFAMNQFQYVESDWSGQGSMSHFGINSLYCRNGCHVVLLLSHLSDSWHCFPLAPQRNFISVWIAKPQESTERLPVFLRVIPLTPFGRCWMHVWHILLLVWITEYV